MRALLRNSTSLCVFSVFTCLICSGYGFAWIDPATCLGAWLFDEDGVEMVGDISGNEHNGTVKGDPEWEDGKFGMALKLDGQGDYVDFGDRDSLDVGTSDFSIVAWLKCAEYTPAGWRNDIVNKLDTAQPRHGYTLSVRGDSDPANQEKPVAIMGLGQESGQHMFGQSPINDDTWHHLALTVDRHGSMILYRDGEIESQSNIAAYSNENEDNTKNFNIGAQAGSQTIQAMIDEVGIFNVVLTQEEIGGIMSNGLQWELGLTAVSHERKLVATWAGIKALY